MAKFNLFGFKIGGKSPDTEKEVIPSFSPPVLDDGALTVATAANFGLSIDLDATYKNEVELISKYRELALQPELEFAIEEIINEVIVFDDDEFNPVEIVTDNLKVSPKIKSALQEEFNNILTLLNFRTLGQDIFRKFYVDGRLYFNVIVNPEETNKGIVELRYIDPRRLTKIRDLKKSKDNISGAEIILGYDEYYVYSSKFSTKESKTDGLKISPDSIISITSGLMDARKSTIIGYLHKAIRAVNMLRQIEDASIVYKISRAPERRIFYVDVGNLPKTKADQYLKDLMTKYKNKVVFNAADGQIQDDRRFLCLDMNTKIPLLDGRTLTLHAIADEYNEGKTNWAYSCDPNTGKFQPGLITWAGVTRKDAPVMKLTLDNGKEIICTPEHKFPVWNKGLVRADELVVGESMIPHYTRLEKLQQNKGQKYQQIFENESKEWKFTHRLVSNWKDENLFENEYVYNEAYKNERKITVHHKNINRLDNTPENLVRMNSKDHFKMHSIIGTNGGKISKELKLGIFNTEHPDYENWKKKAGANDTGRKKLAILMKDPEWNSSFREKQRLGWTEEKRNNASNRAKLTNLSSKGNDKKSELYSDKESNLSKNHVKLYKTEYPESVINFIADCAKNKTNKKEALNKINNEIELLKDFSEINKNKVTSKQKSFSFINDEDINRISIILGCKNYTKLVESLVFKNHKIVKIEYLKETMDTGCLTIDGDEKYHNYHTFALDAGIYSSNSLQEDYWMPRRSDSKSTEITTLPSSGAFDDMSMVEYFEKKLYKTLNVPYSRLHQPETGFSIGRSNEISREELKFAKFVQKLRNKFSDIFTQALRVQCILKNICSPEEFDEYKQYLTYNWKKDNNYSELKEAELLINRLNVLSQIDIYVGKYYSMNWVKHKVLNLTDKDIKEIDSEIEKEVNDGLYPSQKIDLSATPSPEEDQQEEPDQTNNADQNTQQKPKNPYL